jgi:excinuclease ABC subunit B
VGRAARNLNGEVIMFADKITESMQRTIDETERRRTIQMKYNADHGITPTAIVKPRTALPGVDAPEAAPEVVPARAPRRGPAAPRPYVGEYAAGADVAADPVVAMMSREEIEHQIERLRSEMLAAAKDMQFIEAARLRDEMLRLTALAAK